MFIPSEIFWTSFVGIVAGLVLAVSNQCFKSKCKEVSCCCIKIVRDIEAETELEMRQPQSPQSPNPIRTRELRAHI
jgi:hypothetical protein